MQFSVCAAASAAAGAQGWAGGAAQLRAVVERGDGEWCVRGDGGEGGWGAGNAGSVYAGGGGLAVLWARHEDEGTVLAWSMEQRAFDAVVKAVDAAAKR